MKYIEFDNTYGRLSNHFYLVLQAHKFSKILNDNIKYIKNKSAYDFNLHQSFNDFGMSEYVIDRFQLDKSIQCYKNIDHISKRYHQLFNVDFTLNELESFINDTFLKSVTFQNNTIDYNDTTIAIHIRNGDYIGDKGLDIFDRYSYIENSLKCVDNKINKLVVFSDDNKMNEELYDNIFRKHFTTVKYMIGTTGQEDFISFSKHKNKILWNSTFSYWAAFIGNVIHPHSYQNVIAPSRFGRSDPIADHVNPLWRIIEV